MTRGIGIIDFDTGEVTELSDDKILKIYHRTDLERRKINSKLFFKLFKDSLVFFSDMNIHYSAIRTFFKLIEYINFDNEFLSKNGLLLNIKGISKLCNINMSTLKNHIKKLEKAEVLRRVKSGRNVNILINPYFIGYGQDNTTIALRTFAKTKWADSLSYKYKK